MKFFTVQIATRKVISNDTYIFRVQPKPFDFVAGQFVVIKNPIYKPQEIHAFSIASSPLQKNYLEFCIKTYGQWTKEFCRKAKGDTIEISEPQGNFLWDQAISHAVFLLGGIGISPIMSILRSLAKQQTKPISITMLYGNRTPKTIVYQKELERLQTKLPLRIIHIFSHITDNHPWKGYRGFITREMIEKESNLDNKPSFFIIGPPIFIEKMKDILQALHIPQSYIRQELLSSQ